MDRNHLRHVAADRLPLGNLGMSEEFHPLQLVSSALHFTSDQIHKLSNVFGQQKNKHLTSWDDWNIVPDDDVVVDPVQEDTKDSREVIVIDDNTQDEQTYEEPA